MLSIDVAGKGDILAPNNLKKDKKVLQKRLDSVLLERDNILKELTNTYKLLEAS